MGTRRGHEKGEGEEVYEGRGHVKEQKGTKVWGEERKEGVRV